jgi:hypothetical protein
MPLLIADATGRSLPMVTQGAPAQKPDRDRASILVVGDLVSVARAVGDHLRRQGYEVIRARDGNVLLTIGLDENKNDA